MSEAKCGLGNRKQVKRVEGRFLFRALGSHLHFDSPSSPQSSVTLRSAPISTSRLLPPKRQGTPAGPLDVSFITLFFFLFFLSFSFSLFLLFTFFSVLMMTLKESSTAHTWNGLIEGQPFNMSYSYELQASIRGLLGALSETVSSAIPYHAKQFNTAIITTTYHYYYSYNYDSHHC